MSMDKILERLGEETGLHDILGACGCFPNALEHLLDCLDGGALFRQEQWEDAVRRHGRSIHDFTREVAIREGLGWTELASTRLPLGGRTSLVK
jgi:hypothetical protein